MPQQLAAFFKRKEPCTSSFGGVRVGFLSKRRTPSRSSEEFVFPSCTRGSSQYVIVDAQSVDEKCSVACLFTDLALGHWKIFSSKGALYQLAGGARVGLLSLKRRSPTRTNLKQMTGSTNRSSKGSQSRTPALLCLVVCKGFTPAEQWNCHA